MFIKVTLIKGLTAPLTYKVPESWTEKNLIGSIVRVPVKNTIRSAVVIDQVNTLQKQPYTIKEVHSLESLPKDSHYYPFITTLARYYQTSPLYFIKRIYAFLHEKEAPVTPTLLSSEQQSDIIRTTVTLTDEQHTVVTALQPHIAMPSYKPTVLHGVTGSGKTEIYKKLILHAVAHKKSVVFLVPEVTMARQFEQIFKRELPATTKVLSFHSASHTTEKRRVWQALMNGEPIVLLGVHVPPLLPLPHLGLIIVDEEHATGYQEKKHPKVNSKDAALLRAQLHGIPIVLGSATPTLTTLYNVKTRGWQFFQLKKRFAGAFPLVKTVLLPEKKDRRRSFWISKELEIAIADRLKKSEQTILFLNRRGFSFFVQCKQCSFTFTCSNCSVSLTLHQDAYLRCHYCGFTKRLPDKCPACKAPEKELIKKGIGTQQIVNIIQQLFPHARIGRADLDVTSKKKAWKETLTAFTNQEIDILVGTQTITKGFHFPHVTLVGILWADINLHFPLFNAAETTLQQLIQVAGRAGRQHTESLVIVQTMLDHPIFTHIHEVNYLSFYAEELKKRKLFSYPPYARLAEIELKHTSEKTVAQEAQLAVEKLMHVRTQTYKDIQILGPAVPPVQRIKRTYSRKIYIKGTRISDLVYAFEQIQKISWQSRIFFTPNPVQ